MVYVTSDLHGYPKDKFLTLLDKAGFSERDYLFVLGDVIDRGDDGVALLEWFMLQPNASLVLGNHEAMLLSCRFLFGEITDETIAALSDEEKELFSVWMLNGGMSTLNALKPLDKQRILDIVDYIAEAPLYEAVSAGGRDFLLVHSGLGGFSKDKRLKDYSPDQLLWTRPKLSELYYDDVMTVLGHTPTVCYGKEYEGKAIITPTWINIDTGAARGKAPMLLRLDDMKEFYV